MQRALSILEARGQLYHAMVSPPVPRLVPVTVIVIVSDASPP